MFSGELITIVCVELYILFTRNCMHQWIIQTISIPVNPKSDIFSRFFNDQDPTQFKEHSLSPKVVIFLEDKYVKKKM